jgi:hypothetical protein
VTCLEEERRDVVPTTKAHVKGGHLVGIEALSESPVGRGKLCGTPELLSNCPDFVGPLTGIVAARRWHPRGW